MFDRIIYPLIAFLLGIVLVGDLLNDELETATATMITLDADLKYTLHKLEVARNTCPERYVCYEPYGAAPQAEYVMKGSIVMVRFVDKAKMPAGLEAYAEFTPDFDTDVSLCVITVQFPTHVLGDPIMDSIGHEFLHCIIGDFHP